MPTKKARRLLTPGLEKGLVWLPPCGNSGPSVTSVTDARGANSPEVRKTLASLGVRLRDSVEWSSWEDSVGPRGPLVIVGGRPVALSLVPARLYLLRRRKFHLVRRFFRQVEHRVKHYCGGETAAWRSGPKKSWRNHRTVCRDRRSYCLSRQAPAAVRIWRCGGNPLQDESTSLGDEPEYREFVALVDAHGGALLALLRRLCRNEQDAEDAFQETAARVWRSFASRPALRNPRGWLMTIGYRAFLDQQARVKVHEALTDSPDWNAGPPPERAIRNEEAGRVHAALEQLAEPIREVLALHYTGGLSLRQTAEAMGVSEGTVKSRLHAGLNQIRRILE